MKGTVDSETAADLNEEKIIRELKREPCIPAYYEFGIERFKGLLYQYQIIQPMGPSLKLCFTFMKKKFTLQTVCTLAVQIVILNANFQLLKEQLTILERIHGLGIVHGNLRPRKLLTSSNNSDNDLYLIDFSTAVKLKKKPGKQFTLQGHQRNEYQKTSHLNKFSSLGDHVKLGCSPKDDLESLGYILIYFLQNGVIFETKGKTQDEKLKSYEESKLKLIPEQDFKDVPREFQQYLSYIRMSNINDYPLKDYEFLRKIFRKLLSTLGGHERMPYEWVNLMKTQSKNSQLPSQRNISQQNISNFNNSSKDIHDAGKLFPMQQFVQVSVDLPKIESPREPHSKKTQKSIKQTENNQQENNVPQEQSQDSFLSDSDVSLDSDDTVSNRIKSLQNHLSPKFKDEFLSMSKRSVNHMFKNTASFHQK